jgi:hypothetical protein
MSMTAPVKKRKGAARKAGAGVALRRAVCRALDCRLKLT